MMKKGFCLFAFITCLHLCMAGVATAQADSTLPKITGEFRKTATENFLLQVEQQTGYTFYFDRAELMGDTVDISFRNEPVDKALRRAFEEKLFVFSFDQQQKRVFVSRNHAVKTMLADNLFDDAVQKKTKTTGIVADEDTAKTDEESLRSTLDNKLYTIGDKSRAGNMTGRVTIAGYVRDAKTGEPVIGASILLDKSKTGVTSDQYGYYSLTIPKGRSVLNILSLGMRDARRQLMVYGEGRMNIELQQQVIALKNVTVSGEKTSLIRGMQMGVQKIDIKAIKQVPVVFGEADVLRVVMTLPGVKTVGEASTGLNVRGGAADQNLILFNDATVFNPSHFFGLFSAFNPEVVKDVQLYKSVIPAKYGGRLSSVLEVNSREGNKKNVTGSAGIGLLTSRINVEGPIAKDKTSFIVGARSTYANWLLNLLPDEYENSRASFYDINLNISHEINKKNNLYFTGYLSKDRFNLNNDTAYGYGNQNISLKWKHVFNNKWYTTLSGGHDRYNYTIASDATPIQAYKLGFDINQSYLKAHANYYANSRQTIEFGVNTQYYQLHPGAYTPSGQASLITKEILPAEQALESALYVSDKYSFTPELSVEGAVRYSMFNYLGPQTINNYVPGIPKTESTITGTTSYDKGKMIKTYQGPEYRVSARYLFNQNFSVKAGYSTQRQYIHMLSNTAAIAPTDIWKLSDPNIRPQYGNQASLGLYHNFKSNTIEASLEFYFKTMQDFLDYKSGAKLVLNRHIETDVVSTHGKAYGLELLVKKSTGKFNGWISYTYSRTLLQMSDSSIGNPINKGAYYPASYDKPHDITFVGNCRVSHRFSISLNTSYSTGRPITLPIGRFQYAGSERTLYSDRNGYRIPDYFRIDFSMNIEGNHKVHQLTHNSFTIGIYNLTGRKNPYSVYYVSENGLVNGYKLSIFGSMIPYINYNIRF